ncbi:uncharacterized protein LOC135488112 isoform X2 [Lineus longissimus]|uniref:uncharacterized protein LOC135488112 isoform X2 n=1 Tax=Lineus longissimus TaxID=88925 RepID=UPI002B4E4ED4
MSSPRPDLTAACVKNVRRQKELEVQVAELDKERERNVRRMHLRELELMHEQEKYVDTAKFLEYYDPKMQAQDLARYVNDKDEQVREQKKLKFDKYSSLSPKPVDRIPVPKSVYHDEKGVTYVCKDDTTVVKARRMIGNSATMDDVGYVTSGNHYKYKRLLEKMRMVSLKEDDNDEKLSK